MSTNTLKGFKQVSRSSFSSTSDVNKKGYLWFVRPDGATSATTEGDIYLGTRHYGHCGCETEISLINTKITGILSKCGLSSTASGEISISGLTGTFVSGATSLVEALNILDETIVDDEKTIAEALNDLNDNKVSSARTITAGTGLNGGGNLSTDRTLSVIYGSTSGTTCEGNDARLSDARIPLAHNQASETINSMTGYSKPASYSAITTGDTLNVAIGKIEAAVYGVEDLLAAL